jgi:hypothetical protein
LLIREAGGQFCKCEKGAWFEVGDRYAKGERFTSATCCTLSPPIICRPPSKESQPKQTLPALDGRRVADGTGHSDDSSSASPCTRVAAQIPLRVHSWMLASFDIDVF